LNAKGKPTLAEQIIENRPGPFLKWAGGKRWLVARKLGLFPSDYHTYFEPFLGSAAVFFSLNPATAVLSDSNKELIATYRAIKLNWKAVVGHLETHQRSHCKEYYYEVRARCPSDIYERASRFIYLNRTCWNGLYRVNRNGRFNVPIGTKTKVLTEKDNFESISMRLKNVRLLDLDFEKVINQAAKDDFIYIDPPFTVNHPTNGFIKYNDHLFQWRDQLRLRDAVARARDRGAKFLISNAWHPSIKDLYKTGFRTIEVERSSVISGSVSSRGRRLEYLILGV
jgi:DNA adenine methylase